MAVTARAVFKYVLKCSKFLLGHIVHAVRAMTGLRLVGSFQWLFLQPFHGLSPTNVTSPRQSRRLTPLYANLFPHRPDHAHSVRRRFQRVWPPHRFWHA